MQSCKRSLHTVIQHVLKTYHPNDSILYGESIGGAITACVAAEYIGKVSFGKVILQSTFTNITAMARNFTKWSSLVPLLIEELEVKDACKRLSRASENVLIMHAREDEVVPFHMFLTLAPFAKYTHILRGRHNETIFDDEVAHVIKDGI